MAQDFKAVDIIIVMEITILGVVRQLPVHTISLGKNEKNPKNTYLFHCPYCRQAIAQVQGRVDKIFPGLEPSADVPVVFKCGQCHRTYTFQTHNYKYKDITRVTLANQDNIINTLHCFVCTTPLVQFKDDKIWTLPEFKLNTIPFTLKCYKQSCGKEYLISDVV